MSSDIKPRDKDVMRMSPWYFCFLTSKHTVKANSQRVCNKFMFFWQINYKNFSLRPLNWIIGEINQIYRRH